MILDRTSDLAGHVTAWEELARDPMEPNVFHEPWMLLPALRAFAGDPGMDSGPATQGTQLRLVLAYLPPARPGIAPRLAGVFPMELATHYKGLPVTHLRLWRHKHCFLGTPLLRRELAADCIAALLCWLARHQPRARFVEWELISTDGPFHEALKEGLARTRLPAFRAEATTRAMMRPRGDAASFLAMTMPGKSLRELRRVQRRLHEQGEVRVEVLGPGDNAFGWVAEFLELESRGWKGRRGSALASTAANRHFFIEAATAAAQRGQLMMMRMMLGDRPVAMKCNLLAADGAYAFKIAYDEDHARFSPGLLLELAHVEEFHRRGLAWLDWCAEPDHFMANRLSLDRRSLQSLVTAIDTPASRLLVSSLPALRWCRRTLRQLSVTHRKADAGMPGVAAQQEEHR